MTELRHSRSIIRHERFRHINQRKRIARFLHWVTPTDGFFNKSKTLCECHPDEKYRDAPRQKKVRDWEEFDD